MAVYYFQPSAPSLFKFVGRSVKSVRSRLMKFGRKRVSLTPYEYSVARHLLVIIESEQIDFSEPQFFYLAFSYIELFQGKLMDGVRKRTGYTLTLLYSFLRGRGAPALYPQSRIKAVKQIAVVLRELEGASR